MSIGRTIYKKYVFGLSFLLRQDQDFLLEIYTPRKVKDVKMAQVS